jgi:hypothetical protein
LRRGFSVHRSYQLAGSSRRLGRRAGRAGKTINDFNIPGSERTEPSLYPFVLTRFLHASRNPLETALIEKKTIFLSADDIPLAPHCKPATRVTLTLGRPGDAAGLSPFGRTPYDFSNCSQVQSGAGDVINDGNVRIVRV